VKKANHHPTGIELYMV